MSDRGIEIVRAVLLFSAVVNGLLATVAHNWANRHFFERWHAMNERAGNTIPPLFRDPRFMRAWPAFMALVLAGLWWYFGTTAGMESLREVGTR